MDFFLPIIPIAEFKQIAGMKKIREVIGYFLGGLLFVGLMPMMMWLASGMPDPHQ